MSTIPDPWFDQWEPYVNSELDEPLGYSDRVLQLYLQVLAMTLAETDLVEPENRTVLQLLEGVRRRILQFEDKYPNEIAPLLRLVSKFSWVVGVYQHQQLFGLGQPLQACTLDPPCPYHSVDGAS